MYHSVGLWSGPSFGPGLHVISGPEAWRKAGLDPPYPTYISALTKQDPVGTGIRNALKALKEYPVGTGIRNAIKALKECS